MNHLAVPTRSRARTLYRRAQINRWFGRHSVAADLCRRALDVCDYYKAYELLARLVLHGEDYIQVLQQVHEHLKPETYVEIGVSRGTSFRLVGPRTRAVGIDPSPQLNLDALAPQQKVFVQTSDDFFAQHDLIAELGGQRVRMAFIDGMHHFEFALRDFANLEPLCHPDSVIFIHDCYPLDARSAARERTTRFWSGDVWRLIVLLKKYRPDLQVHTIATSPTGLGMITGLDPTSQVLKEKLPVLIEEGLAMDLNVIAQRRAEALNLFPNEWGRVRGVLDGR